MNKILVTGSSGFIGTNLISYLMKDSKIMVLGVDLLPPKIDSHKKIWKKIDFRDKVSLLQVVDNFKPNIIIHLGAKTDLNGKSLKDYNSNSDGVSNLIEVIAKVGTIERTIFASSMYVCMPGYVPNSFEDYKPHTIYGESKVLSEKIIKNSPLLENYTWSIIRPTSIWGPWFGEPYKNFFDIVLSGKYMHMGSKACMKTYGYIDNTVFQIIKLLNSPKEKIHKKVFYLGDYENYDISEWADEIANYANLRIPKVPYVIFNLLAYIGDFLKLLKIKFPMTSFRLKNMTTNNVHDLSFIKEIVGDLPVSRIKGVKKTVNWIRKNNE
jgi:nucleoside-diphosphate-sugar epimerase